MLIRDMRDKESTPYEIRFDEIVRENEYDFDEAFIKGKGYTTLKAFKNGVSLKAIALKMVNANGLYDTRIENGEVVGHNNNPHFCGIGKDTTQKQAEAAMNDLKKHMKLKDNELEIIISAPKEFDSSINTNDEDFNDDLYSYYFAKTQIIPIERLGGQLIKAQNFMFELSNNYLFSNSILDLILKHHPKKKHLIMSKDSEGHNRLQNLSLKHSLHLEVSQEDVLEQMNYGEAEEILEDRVFYYPLKNAIYIQLGVDDILPAELFDSN